MLNRSGDDLRIDWGYFHLSVPKDEESSSAIVQETSVAEDGTFATTGALPKADAMDASPVVGRGDAHLAVELPFHTVSEQAMTRHVLVSYTEGYAIQYLGRNLKPWWARNGETVADMLDKAEQQMPELDQKATALDQELTADLVKAGGQKYADLCVLGVSAGMGGAWVCGGCGWDTAGIWQGELLEWKYWDGRCAVSGVTVFSAAEPGAA